MKECVGLLPIIDVEKKLVGVVRLCNLLSLELPDFVNFVADLDFVHELGAVETTCPSAEVLDQSIKTLMTPAIRVSEDEKVVDMASRVDIGAVILSAWAKIE